MNTVLVHNENAAVEKAARGDRQAFDSLVDQHYRGVYAYAMRMLRNADDAADATQATFVKAHRSLREFDTSRPLKPWLYRICGNVCIDMARSKHRSHEDLDQHAYMLEGGEKPQEVAERSEMQRKIWRAVMKLPERYRRIVLLRHYEQMDVEEIAKTLGAPEGTIKSWLFRARAILRKELAGILEPAPKKMAV